MNENINSPPQQYGIGMISPAQMGPLSQGSQLSHISSPGVTNGLTQLPMGLGVNNGIGSNYSGVSFVNAPNGLSSINSFRNNNAHNGNTGNNGNNGKYMNSNGKLSNNNNHNNHNNQSNHNNQNSNDDDNNDDLYSPPTEDEEDPQLRRAKELQKLNGNYKVRLDFGGWGALDVTIPPSSRGSFSGGNLMLESSMLKQSSVGTDKDDNGNNKNNISHGYNNSNINNHNHNHNIHNSNHHHNVYHDKGGGSTLGGGLRQRGLNLQQLQQQQQQNGRNDSLFTNSIGGASTVDFENISNAPSNFTNATGMTSIPESNVGKEMEKNLPLL